MARSLFLLLALFAAVPARADVDIGFWSRELGVEMPHAFFVAKGSANGAPVDISYGFTARAVSPAILWGSVPGRLDATSRRYIAASHEQFRLTIGDAAYARVLAVVERYRSGPEAHYNMNTRNCIHFIGEVAQAAGLKVVFEPALLKRPTSFLRAIAAANPNVTMVAK